MTHRMFERLNFFPKIYDNSDQEITKKKFFLSWPFSSAQTSNDFEALGFNLDAFHILSLFCKIHTSITNVLTELMEKKTPEWSFHKIFNISFPRAVE